MVKQFYKIGEVAKILDIKSSVLRFWETEFKQITPQKSSSGQRFYSQKDIELLSKIKDMLHVQKFTIEGAKKQLRTSKNLYLEYSNGGLSENHTGKLPSTNILVNNKELDNSQKIVQNISIKEDLKEDLIKLLNILKC